MIILAIHVPKTPSYPTTPFLGMIARKEASSSTSVIGQIH